MGHATFTLHPGDRAGVADLVGTLDVVAPHSSSIVETLAPRLRELVGGMTVVTRPVGGRGSHGFEYMFGAGPAPEVTRFREAFLRMPPPPRDEFTLYDPIRPEARQRNVIVDDRQMRAMVRRQMTATWKVYRRLGVDRMSQLRSLVCDGPMLLAWVGAFRDEPFGRRERAILSALIEPIGRRLRVERLLGGECWMGKALAATLDAFPGPAFLVLAGGRVDFANEAASAVLQVRPKALLDQVAEAIRGVAPPGLAVVPLSENGAPRRYLVLMRDRGTERATRVSRARREWGLTARQAEVLDHVVHGEPNKDVAAKLGCSPRTIELHVGALLRKARVESRTQLASRFWA